MQMGMCVVTRRTGEELEKWSELGGSGAGQI